MPPPASPLMKFLNRSIEELAELLLGLGLLTLTNKPSTVLHYGRPTATVSPVVVMGAAAGRRPTGRK